MVAVEQVADQQMDQEMFQAGWVAEALADFKLVQQAQQTPAVVVVASIKLTAEELHVVAPGL